MIAITVLSSGHITCILWAVLLWFRRFNSDIKAPTRSQSIFAGPELKHTSGALKAWPCCLQSLLHAAHVCCCTLHLCNICEEIRRALQQAAQNPAGLHTCVWYWKSLNLTVSSVNTHEEEQKSSPGMKASVTLSGVSLNLQRRLAGLAPVVEEGDRALS